LNTTRPVSAQPIAIKKANIIMASDEPH
jgi:hypothetical protein